MGLNRDGPGYLLSIRFVGILMHYTLLIKLSDTRLLSMFLRCGKRDNIVGHRSASI